MRLSVFLITLFLALPIFAETTIPAEYQISSLTTIEVSSDEFNKFENIDYGMTSGMVQDSIPPRTLDDRLNTGGKIIQTAKDMVALGEAIYDLVKKGKPTNVTEYAPISVVPRDPITKEYVDPFDLEGFSMPVEKNFITIIKNGFGQAVVKFSYKVLYSYGGSYNGKGRYLANVIIVPGSIRTSFGWDFTASMKLSGIMNHGTKENPVAGIMVTVKYQMNSWITAFERNDTIHINGNGYLKNHNK